MLKYLENIRHAMRPPFSRQAIFVWFLAIGVVFLLRHDTVERV